MMYIWLGIIILLTLLELLTINLTSIWFIISGVGALIVSYFTSNFVIQLAVFVLGGVVLLILTKPFIEKFVKSKNEKTNIDRIVGMHGVVTEKIQKNKYGEVKVYGKRWTAYSDEKLDVNDIITVLMIDGVKLKVKKEEN